MQELEHEEEQDGSRRSIFTDDYLDKKGPLPVPRRSFSPSPPPSLPPPPPFHPIASTPRLPIFLYHPHVNATDFGAASPPPAMVRRWQRGRRGWQRA